MKQANRRTDVKIHHAEIKTQDVEDYVNTGIYQNRLAYGIGLLADIPLFCLFSKLARRKCGEMGSAYLFLVVASN